MFKFCKEILLIEVCGTEEIYKFKHFCFCPVLVLAKQHCQATFTLKKCQ